MAAFLQLLAALAGFGIICLIGALPLGAITVFVRFRRGLRDSGFLVGGIPIGAALERGIGPDDTWPRHVVVLLVIVMLVGLIFLGAALHGEKHAPKEPTNTDLGEQNEELRQQNEELRQQHAKSHAEQMEEFARLTKLLEERLPLSGNLPNTPPPVPADSPLIPASGGGAGAAIVRPEPRTPESTTATPGGGVPPTPISAGSGSVAPPNPVSQDSHDEAR